MSWFLIDAPEYVCQTLVERHLLRPEGSLYLFAHALIQEGAYSSLLNQQRIEWHRLAANWYAERDLILHAEHLGFAGDAAAPSAYHGAAQDQFTRFRPERALQLVRVGLKVASVPDSFELKCLEGELLRILGSASGSITAFRSAYEVATDGRGNHNQDIIQELRRVHDETSRAELKFALPELEAALHSK